MENYGVKIFYITFEEDKDTHLFHGYAGHDQPLYKTTNEQHLEITNILNKYCLEDKAHFNQQGHYYVAKVLEEKLRQQGII